MIPRQSAFAAGAIVLGSCSADAATGGTLTLRANDSASKLTTLADSRGTVRKLASKRGTAQLGVSSGKVSPFRAVAIAAVAVALLLSWAPPASASPVRAAAPASTFGGTTGQGFPVIVDVNGAKTRVVRILAAVRMSCRPSGGVFTLPTGFRQLPVARSGRFHAAFGPITQRNDDGTTTDFSARMTARFNRARTSVAGTWRFSAVDHDAVGAVVDTCTSPLVRWHAKQ